MNGRYKINEMFHIMWAENCIINENLKELNSSQFSLYFYFSTFEIINNMIAMRIVNEKFMILFM